MPAISVDTISGIACLDNIGCACIQTGGCNALHGTSFCSYGMEYKKCTDVTWCQYPNPLTCGSLGVGVTCYNVTIPNLDNNTCYQYHAIACSISNAVSGTTLSIQTPVYYPWVTATPLQLGPVPIPGTCYNYVITGLTANTIYEYRSYMIICGVEYCGKNSYQVATCATPVFLPTVCTNPMDIIDETTASGGGCVSSDGGTPVTARGVAWRTGFNPTTGNTYTCDGGGTGCYTSSLSGLLPNTTYNVRAYAVNCVGISYGNTVSFTTLAPKSINLYQSAYNGGDDSYNSCRHLCIYSIAAMSLGECYCLCLYLPMEMPISLIGSGSYASVCVTCNGTCQFCACLTNSPCINSQTSLLVHYGDCVDIYNDAYTTALGCSGGVNSCTCIGNVTSVSGSFQIGSTCCKSCTHTG